MERKLLFRLTKKDFMVEPFKGSGSGGQHRNKTMSCCRIKHIKSGAIGIGTEQRQFFKNRRKAFERLVETEEFKKWHRLEVAKYLGNLLNIDEQVDKMMNEKNLRIEVKDENGKWVQTSLDDIKYDDVFDELQEECKHKNKEVSTGHLNDHALCLDCGYETMDYCNMSPNMEHKFELIEDIGVDFCIYCNIPEERE